MPTSVGKLKAGRMLISNFNARETAKENGQGTGSTIVQVSSSGKVTPFATLDASRFRARARGAWASRQR